MGAADLAEMSWMLHRTTIAMEQEHEQTEKKEGELFLLQMIMGSVRSMADKKKRPDWSLDKDYQDGNGFFFFFLPGHGCVNKSYTSEFSF